VIARFNDSFQSQSRVHGLYEINVVPECHPDRSSRALPRSSATTLGNFAHRAFKAQLVSYRL
jgi:hypothetical protein